MNTLKNTLNQPFLRQPALLDNKLLAALSPEELDYWSANLELVEMTLNQVLCEPGKTPTFMFFPTTAIVSLIYITTDGSSSEVAVIGNDGVVGISLFMTDSHTLNHAKVQSTGLGYKLKAKAAKNILNRGGPLLKILLNYSLKMIYQVNQTAASNRLYSIDQRLSRRLLLNLDRVPSNNFKMTHEMLGNLLGVRRESITESALRLQEAGIITYTRGVITIIDRVKLESNCSECYFLPITEYESFSFH